VRDWCKHYRGMSGKTVCEAGVEFATLPNYGTKQFMASCPCFEKHEGCDKAEYKTPEELAEEERQLAKLFARTTTARKAIVDALGGPWQRGMKTQSGEIDCPICGKTKTLRYSRSGYNGHIHARCDTDGCVAWME
jgi:hypothetical protein